MFTKPIFYCFSVPQDYKLNPGAVEAVLEQPDQPNNILIGYNRGLIVLWNRAENTAVKTFINNQQLESLCWNDSGKSFTSSHNDGKRVYNLICFSCEWSSNHLWFGIV